MKNKETGEFELVVGDKQLLSGFFIGVVLLAVVFALGYVLGRSSPKSAGVAADTTTVVPNSSESRPQASSPSVPASAEPATANPRAGVMDSAEPEKSAEEHPQPTTVPARDTSGPAAAAPSPAQSPASEPANSSYWQVTAGSRTSADAVEQTLKDKGFPASTRPGPNNLTVVWVGPYTDKETLTRAKKALEEAGFTEHILKHP